MNETNVQRNYKDTVFRMLFREKKNLLSLYNALNKTAYTDVDSLEITTLENAVYTNYKNDKSMSITKRICAVWRTGQNLCKGERLFQK